MKTKQDLKTKEGRIEALEALNKECLNAFKTIGVELSEDAVLKLDNRSIELGIKGDKPYYHIAFASEISLYTNKSFSEKEYSKPSMNYGSSGSFDTTNKASYWRTIHAASLLKNWTAVCFIINQYCGEYERFVELCFAEKEVTNAK